VIIDAHTHIWPDSIAARALAGTLPDLEVFGDGTKAGLLASMERNGIDRSICLGVANNAPQVPLANKFAAGLDDDRLIGFGSIHADADPAETLTDLAHRGLKGVKVHPIFQGYAIDDPGVLPLFDAFQETGTVVIMHVGAGSTPDVTARSTPDKLRGLVERFPRLKLIACHFGGYRLFEQAEDLICGLPVYLDTSWPPSVADLDPARVRSFIERHGPDRIIFASDWPMSDPGEEIEAIERLGLSAEATEMVFGGNMARLLTYNSEVRSQKSDRSLPDV
jgi:predicted TIM-barrel fold metal-dependent hydrolase